MAGPVLVLNCGSSSIKAAVFADGDHAVLRVGVERIGAGPVARFSGDEADVTPPVDGHTALLDWLLGEIAERAGTPDAVGHRVVHGGLNFADPVAVTPEVVGQLEQLIPMARSHQPHNLAGIAAVAARWPDLPQTACFDTAFHRTIPEVRQRFALPPELTAKGIRRYGFHGLSYEWIARRLPDFTDMADGKVVVAHLGNGASLCAMRHRASRATTMGFTPLDGLIMGNRPGTLDPGAVLYLFDELGYSTAEVRSLLFDQSGLLGVSHLSNDMRSLLASEEPDAKMAVNLFVERAVREIAAMAAALRGIDALVFTGGIGQHAAPIRAGIAKGCAWLGAMLDRHANTVNAPLISTEESGIEMLVIPTDEEAMIAAHCRP
ncbi:MAG: acetate/propionate family kinase [Pseudomonadota bacterium]